MNGSEPDNQASDLDIAMMQLAILQAKLAGDLGEVPVGAVVYRGDEVLATGYNFRESSADPTAHAEIVAMKAAALKIGTWRLDDCSVAVTLEPCPMCAGAMINGRVARVVYGAADPKMGCVDTLYQLCTDLRFNHRLVVVSGVMGDECGVLLSDFFKLRRGDNRPAKPKLGN